MSVKFNVSIPDDLQKEIEPYLDRIRPSKVFQEALMAQISKFRERERALPKGETMDAIIERLRREKRESESHDYEDGKTEGLRVIQGVSYDEVKSAVRIAEKQRDFYREYSYVNGDLIFKDEDWGAYFLDEVTKEIKMLLNK